MDYTGTEELEILKHANNYNNFLVNRILRNVHGSKILDFGAGIGTFLEYVKNALNTDVKGLEIDTKQREYMLAQGHSVYASIDEVEKESFSTIYSLNVLEHIPDDQEAINNIFDKLEPGGVFYCYVPAFEVLYSEFDKRVGHERRYTRDDLVNKVTKSGFKVKSAKYCDFLGFFAALVFKFLDNTGKINPKMVRLFDKVIFPISSIIDTVTFGYFVGKNIEVVATKP
ncbi:hypothetical protein BIY24_01635 [Halobacteriovorax marinus]|uniref:class I SAM-dependent methyltransferase n=1 Tax=Halobacteriovorax marinus TaxID=97084 RepID=UPI000BC31378|nr:class I SAM-dependent methyltransferase [Halobacteriovorax marinus]ATH06684.1 hypothetical protein BIY24_01635 [Halobacteriovorax marinus]